MADPVKKTHFTGPSGVYDNKTYIFLKERMVQVIQYNTNTVFTFLYSCSTSQVVVSAALHLHYLLTYRFIFLQPSNQLFPANSSA